MDFLKARILACSNGDAMPDSNRVTAKELYDALLADYRINGKSHWWAELNWRVHLEPFFGTMLAKNVGSNTLDRYKESRLKQGASNGSINRELSLLQRSFMIGYEAQPRKVARPLRFHRLAESKPRQGFIEQKTYDALAVNCSDLFMRTMLAVAFAFGWRKGELLSLKAGDIDLLPSKETPNGTIHLRDSKNGEPRTVALTQETRKLLAACVAGKSAEDAVFTRGKGTKAVADFRGTWDKITLAAGCPGLLFHDLRRSGVRNMVRAGITEHVAMKISGHKTASVFRRYDIVDARDLADAAKKIESAALSYTLVAAEEKAKETKQAENVILH
jgi:integrase